MDFSEARQKFKTEYRSETTLSESLVTVDGNTLKPIDHYEEVIATPSAL